jgi:zinc transport system ATP-binding protein
MISLNPLLVLDNVSFGYSRNQKAIVEDVSISASPGEFIVFRGPNGCGKSTIVKGVLGLALTLKGSVRWIIDRTSVGYVPQETTICGDIPYTALDIVRYAVKSSGKNSFENARSALASVEMDDKAEFRFGALSGGQKRRVLFARALARNPQLLILDEPTANVDVHTESVIEKMIDGLIVSRQVAIISVAHTVDFGRNARVIKVRDGRIYE